MVRISYIESRYPKKGDGIGSEPTGRALSLIPEP